VLRGHGDPSLTEAGLWRLANALESLGIREVEQLIVDQSRFDNQFVPPAFVLALLASALLAGAGPALALPFAAVPLAAVAGSYLAANLAASLHTARRSGLALAPLLPLAYAVLHLGYGAGFLVGLVRWAGRWGDGHGHLPDLGWDEAP